MPTEVHRNAGDGSPAPATAGRASIADVAPGAGDASVRAVGLEQSYGPIRALRGLTVSLPRGAVGLLGPNGAGKSTLLKVLMGFIVPESGRAEVLGLDVATHAEEVRRRVGYMPEMDAFLPGLTGAEAVRFAGVMCGLPASHAQRRAHEILYYVGLGEARYRRSEEYSTGMRQRLRLAQSLVHDPELIFLDEPTNGLDPKGREEMLALIADLVTRHGKSVVLCSHLLPDVESVCKNVVVLRGGEIALQGSIEDVRKLEAGLFRVRIGGDRGAFAAEITARGGNVEGDDGETILVRAASGDARTVFAAAAAARCVVRAISTSEQNLESAFLRAVGSTGAADKAGGA